MFFIKLLFIPREKREFYKNLVKLLHFTPSHFKIYEKAFIHKSASKVISGLIKNNERLEFLGDAVIDTVVADYLFSHYKDKDEGFLTQLRSKIVKRDQLNHFAKMIDIDKMIISESNISENKHIFGNTFEAYIGAIFLDKGYVTAKNYFIKHILEKFIDIDSLQHTETDFKSRLIEWGQKNKQEIIIENKENPDMPKNSPIFTSEIIVELNIIGVGIGTSKKEAEQKASRKALYFLDNKNE